VAIKPRGIEYAKLASDDISVVDLEGKVIEGKYLPSVDLEIHLEIYRHFPEVGAIAHTHSTYATAWAQSGRAVPVLGTTHADHFYGPIRCTRQLTEAEVVGNYEREIGKVVVDAMEGVNAVQIPGILVKGHGPFTWGKTISECVENSLILEEIAKMAAITIGIGGGAEIPGYLLNKHYLRKFGKDAYFYQSK
jgi:L-ribulose-5-phosphate 4-epimerase